MPITLSPSWRHILKTFWQVALLGGVVGLMFFGKNLADMSFGKIFKYWFLMGISTAILWLGNDYLTDLLSKYYSWIEYPVKRFFLSVFVTIAYTLLAFVFIVILFELSSGVKPFQLLESFSIIQVLPTLLITLFISLFPLSISVFSEADNHYLVVQNNLQLKVAVGESTGIGIWLGK
jgi:hypothetical protein